MMVVAGMTKHQVFVIILMLIGLVFLVDELWMFGLPIGHILPDLSEFRVASFGFQYHHWITGVILIVLALVILQDDNKKRNFKG